MPIRLQFFDWREPALPAAARWFVDEFAAGRELDLSQVIVCVPGAQVRRRLLELLVQLSAEKMLMLSPPEIVTPGHLPELLYEAKRPFASELTQRLAWVKVLQGIDRELLAPLVRIPPEKDDLPGWLALAQMLADLHQELASDGLDCEAVLAEAVHCEGFNEAPRWKLLAELERRYLRLLDDLGVWDKQTARLFAIKHRECQSERRIVLVGLVDLNRAQRQMLDAVAGRVTGLVFGPKGSGQLDGSACPHPEGEGGGDGGAGAMFDEHGCLRPQRWQDVRLPLRDEQIEVADSPGDQADAVIRALARLDGRFSAEDIVIGIPDSRLTSFLRQRLEESNLPARQVEAMPVARTGPGQLLAELADYLERRRFSDLASLLRHPSLAKLVAKTLDDDWLTLFDEFYTRHLPANAPEKWPGDRHGKLRKVQGAVNGLLVEFKGVRPLGEWARPILDLVVKIYGGIQLDEEIEPDRTIIKSCGKIRDVLAALLDIDKSFSPTVSASTALRLVLRELEGEKITPRADDEAIELLGWLELIWNDAPAVIITGFNEGIIASPVGRDVFLPNALRQRLPLEDNERRLARDTYALGLIAASRERLHIIAGRRSAENDPLVPSRLLFACGDEELPKRALRLFTSPRETARRILLPGSLRPATESGLLVPQPDPLTEPVEIFNVTEFKSYLACPFRYYLRHRLKLEALSDAASELDPGQFGSLLHEALMRFGQSEAKDSTEVDEIRDCLYLHLGELAAKRYSGVAQPAVQVQVELAKLRLAEFAKKQARRRSEGWRIREVEIEFGADEGQQPPVPLEVDGKPALLAGRIDRIDEHEQTGHWAVLDYKTSESGDSPRKTHGNSDGWTDLQLPLYRHLVAKLDNCPAPDKIQLGYVQLPKDLKQINFTMADWTADELRAADEAAKTVVRGVRQGSFWPPTEPAPPFSEEYSAICQDGRFSSAQLPVETEAEEGEE